MAVGKAGVLRLNMNKANKDTQGATPMREKTSSADLLGSNNEIARKLKQYYQELVSDEIPDRFRELLQRLERADPEKPAGEAEPGERLESTGAKAEG